MEKITKNNLKVGDKIEFKTENWGIYKVERLYNENPHIWEISNTSGWRTLGEGELEHWMFANETTTTEPPPPTNPPPKNRYFVFYRESLAKYLDDNNIKYISSEANILSFELEGHYDESLFKLLEGYFRWHDDQY